jgi:DNA polymerase I-like protein with 3'-5' exonuclease and polymerase domains
MQREQNYLPVLQHYIKAAGYLAMSTSATLSISELVAKAKDTGCQGIFCCNESTLQNLVPGHKPTLDEYRGSRLDYSVPVIIGNSLAHINTVDHGKFLLQTDLAKFKQLRIKEPFHYTVLKTVGDFPEALQKIREAVFVAYDIETVTISKEGKVKKGDVDEESDIGEGGETVITCASYTCFTKAGIFETFVLPFINFMQSHWVSDEAFAAALLFLQEANATDTPKVMQNGMYDCMHSIIYGAWPRNFCLDTMAMMHAQYSSLPKSLDFIASVILPDYQQWKPQAELASSQKDIRQYWEYNAKDTFNTARICLHYLKHFPAYARRNYASQFKLVYPSLYCAFEGFLIDNNKREDLRQARVTVVEEMLKELRILLADPNFNPGSPQQVKKYIYEILGAKDSKIGYRKKDGVKSRIVQGTDEKNLTAVGAQHPILFAVTSRILKYREAQKAIGTYFDFKQKNNRLLYKINPFGTDTGRMSAKKSDLWCGTQIQNIPYYAKEFLIPDEGFMLCEPDNSQSEARCTAYLSECMKLITALETPGIDFYRSLGTLFFQMLYEIVTTEFRNRVLKKIVHGTNYMMGAETFVQNAGVDNILFAARTLGIDVTHANIKAFAAQLLNRYHEAFPEVREWYAKVKNEIATTHMLKSPMGHVRYFFGDIHKKYQIFSSAVAHGPQNLSVSILNIGWWKQWQLQKEEPVDFRMKAQIHDSAPFQYRIGREDIRKKAIDCFNNPVVIHGRTLKIPVDYKEGLNWMNMKKGQENVK